MISVRKKLCVMMVSVFLLITTACTNTSEELIGEQFPKEISYVDLKIGEDYTDLKTKIRFMTNRVDLIDSVDNGKNFQSYVKAFNQIYPDIEIIYEGIANYDEDMRVRLPSPGWGDVCCIPSNIAGEEFSRYFEPLADYQDLKDNYEFIDKSVYQDKMYGIPSGGNVQGIVYNKKVWADAGITELPKMPEEFLHDLALIKQNTNAVPLYTNYASRWALTTWDFYISACATGDKTYRNQKMPFLAEPFAEQPNHTGAYEVYHILYQAVKDDLTEENPEKTNWEASKYMLHDGEISAMVLGSWAVPQMQDAGNFPENIGYMPFPISVDGKQYASAFGDYCYGINNKITEDKKIASMLYLKYLTEQSGYAYDQGCIPVVKGESYPDVLSDFEGAEILEDALPLEGKENAFTEINQKSGLFLESDPEHIAEIVQSAKDGSKDFDTIMNEWNQAWSNAQK